MPSELRSQVLKLSLSAMTAFLLISCGKAPKSEPVSRVKIIGGSSAHPDEFPFMVSLKMKRVLKEAGESSNTRAFHICGATLIAPTKILTAAHCVLSFTEENKHDCNSNEEREDSVQNVDEGWRNELYAVIGEYSQSEVDGQDMEVRRIFPDDIAIHPDYRSCLKGRNDIAVLTLKQASLHKPVALFNGKDELFRPNIDSFEVLGWGMNRPTNGRTPWSQLFPAVLQKASVPFVPTALCFEHYNNLGMTGIINSSVICAGDYIPADQQLAMASPGDASDPSSSRRDACTMDSGGPLLFQNPIEPAQLWQVGIVSAGKGCAVNPGLYTSIAFFADWLSFSDLHF